MGFLDTMDDEGDEGEMQDRIYLDKKQPADMIVRLEDFGLGTRDEDHHNYPGEEFFAAKLTCVDKSKGQPEITEPGEDYDGTTFSYFIDTRESLPKQRARFALKDIASFLSQITGKPKNFFLEKGKRKERIEAACENAEELSGQLFQLDATDATVSKRSGTKFYNPDFIPVEED